MCLPVDALAIDRAVRGIPARRALFHLGVRKLASAGVAIDLLGLPLPPFFTFLLPFVANRQVRVVALLPTRFAAVEFAVAFTTLDPETANVSLIVNLPVDPVAGRIAAVSSEAILGFN